MKRKILIISIMLIIISTSVFADGNGTSGANWLRLGLGVRAAGLGGHFVGLADDVSAMYWNPAGISQIKSRQIDFMQVRYLADINYMYVGGVYPLHDEETVGVYYYSLATPEEPVTTFSSPTGTGENFKDEASVINVSYARPFTSQIKLGISGKMLNENLAGDKKGSFACDVGLLYKDLLPNLNVGVVFQNLGPSLRGSEGLSSNLRVGAAYMLSSRLLAVADINKSMEGDVDLGAGVEYKMNNAITVRSGFNSLRGFSLGLGFLWQSLSFNYAYVPYQNNLGDTHRFSFTYDFDYKPTYEPQEKIEDNTPAEEAPVQEQPKFLKDDKLFDGQTSTTAPEKIISAEQILTQNGVDKLSQQLTQPSSTTANVAAQKSIATDTTQELNDTSLFDTK